MVIGWIAAMALGQEEVCAGGLRPEHLREAMDAIDAAIAEFHGQLAADLVDGVVHELRCLEVPIDPADLGRLARQRSLLAYYQQDPLEATAWAVLARDTVGGAPWPAQVPVPDSFHDFLAELPPPTVAGPEGRGLAPPKRGAVLIDGRVALEPRVVLDTTHFVQVADKRGLVVASVWQHGAAFGEELLGEPGPLELPRWYHEPVAPPPIATPDGGDAVAVADAVASGTAPVTAPPAPVAAPVVRPPVAAPVPTPAPVEVAAPGGVTPTDEVPGEPQGGVRGTTRMAGREARDRMFAAREASERCPWKADPRTVEARAGEVQVNKRAYPVRSDEDQAAFRAVLLACGELKAARRFAKWRDARAHLSLTAGRAKKRMVQALLADEDRKRR